ncbi:hypothetical protein IT396_01390 [Candidatus Nomurabacteria bacterium]|nr:hypothetical protein [Candidatus Nomurabacteria bacterium]
MKILIPSSAGDLIDRITILEIKLLYFTDHAKIANTKKHLTELKKIYKTLPKSKALRKLHLTLFTINKRQWQLEDKVRIYLRKKEWEKAAKHSGLVHKSNAKRIATKQKIDEHIGSTLRDEKHYAQ